MTTIKKLGIWMDHSSAHLIEPGVIGAKTLNSAFTHQAKEKSLNKSENTMHHREQHNHAEYYKEIGAVIKNYNDVLLFGPTDAKTELFNMLRADHLFAAIKIDTRQTDKMTENQQQAFVREYFQNKIS